MTTSKTMPELQSLALAEMMATCPECQDVSGVEIAPVDDLREDGDWAIAGLVRGSPVSARCRRAQIAATLKLRQSYHLIGE